MHLLNRSSEQRYKNKEFLRKFLEEQLFDNPADITIHDIGRVSYQTRTSPKEWFRMILKYLSYPSIELEEAYSSISLVERVGQLMNSYPEAKEVGYLKYFLYERLLVDPGEIKVNDIYIIACRTHILPEEWFDVTLCLSEIDMEEEDFDKND